MALKSGRVGIHPSQVDPITGMLINVPTPGNISFEDLSDAQISNPEVGQTLIYNGTGWENEFSSISPTTLAELQDVQITDPEDGAYLVYDAENNKWINSVTPPAPEYIDLTATLYGAVEDTISFTDAAGISYSEVFASGQSSKSVTFKINPEGSTPITFTSAVAKDPDNLSNDYTKTVSATSATTEIKVMPDKSLYWYGYIGSLETMNTANGWEITINQGTPQYNTNNIYIASASNTFTGVGAKIAVTTTKAYGVLNGHGGLLGMETAKNFSATDYASVTGDTTTKYECSKTSASYYPKVFAQSGNITIYALWYE